MRLCVSLALAALHPLLARPSWLRDGGTECDPKGSWMSNVGKKQCLGFTAEQVSAHRFVYNHLVGCCVPVVEPAKYTNHYPSGDDAFGLLPPGAEDDGSSVGFLLGDHGLSEKKDFAKPGDLFRPGEVGGECCQLDVADLMRKRRLELENENKTLRFILVMGDNFYFDGLKNYTEGGWAQWERWLKVYEGLTDVPWLATLGNHDLGDGDRHATCPWRRPLASIKEQPYACNQLDADKGGSRPPGTESYHLPDFNWETRVAALNLEIYSLDQNYEWAPAMGDFHRGRPAMDEACSGGDFATMERLAAVTAAGERMLVAGAKRLPAGRTRKRRVVLMQHYDKRCEHLAEMFVRAVPEEERALVEILCTFGHDHATRCDGGGEKEQSGAGSDCKHLLVGGGGGCCGGHIVERGGDTGAGFAVLGFPPGGGMEVERVALGRTCVLDPYSTPARQPAHLPSTTPLPPSTCPLQVCGRARANRPGRPTLESTGVPPGCACLPRHPSSRAHRSYGSQGRARTASRAWARSTWRTALRGRRTSQSARLGAKRAPAAEAGARGSCGAARRQMRAPATFAARST